ncbi:MAG: hypothetical protein AUI17_06265 [Acidobacteriales bacterium 13_2_20CM_2_55_5]|nr:MAG: hypothetical protein AUI17_06265 [Acidobacteriales bacterium 13_2_20CM_2_55_5]
MDENRLLRTAVAVGQDLGENPIFEQPPRPLRKIEKLDACLAKVVGPTNAAQGFDANPRRYQFKANVNLLILTQGCNRLQCDARFIKIPENSSVSMIQIYVRQAVNPMAVAAWLSGRSC